MFTGVTLQFACVGVRHLLRLQMRGKRDVHHEAAVPLEKLREHLPVLAAKRRHVFAKAIADTIREGTVSCE